MRLVTLEKHGDGRLPKLVAARLAETKLVALAGAVVVGRDSRQLAIARLKAARAVSVLLLGADTLGLFRPDLKLSQVRGRPFMLNVEDERSPVGVATFHPEGIKTAEMRQTVCDDIDQWIWRGVKQRQGRWPETCVRCAREAEKYDVTGLGWCTDEYPGDEPPRHTVTLTLEV